MVSKYAYALIGRSCRFLEDVDFTETRIDDEGFIFLQLLSNISCWFEFLKLMKRLHGLGLEAISRCGKLAGLKLGLCVCVTDHGLSHVGRHCQNLRELDLYRCVVYVISSCCVRVMTRILKYGFFAFICVTDAWQ